MTGRGDPPPIVRQYHADLVKKLGGLFSVNDMPWDIIRKHVEMVGLLSNSDLGNVGNMEGLFLKLMKKNKIYYGEYTKICGILNGEDVAAGNLIMDYTRRIQKAFNKRGKCRHVSDSDSGLENERESRNRTGVVPLLILNKTVYSVTKGKPVILKCAFKNTTLIRNVQWKRKRKGDVEFSNIKIDNKNYFGGSVNSPPLSIDKTSGEDNGAIYVCQATNDAGTGQSDEIHIKVTQPETDAAARGPGKMFLGEMLENDMEKAKLKIQALAGTSGMLKDITYISGLDTRTINVRFIVHKYTRIRRKKLRKDIAALLGVHRRIVNIQVITGCIIVSFDITGATHPLHASALALAERFTTGLRDGSMLLTDETGNQLQIRQDFTIEETPRTAVDMNLPMVSIDQAAYCVVTGDIVFLKSRLKTSTPITSVAWFRIDKEDGTELAIEIDNEKYFGGSIESPSLVIDDTTVDDAGRYVCHAENSFGVGKSFATSLCISDSDNIETVFAALQAETSLTDSQSEGSSETTSDDDSVTHTLTQNEPPDKFLTSAVAGGHTNTEKLLLEKGRDHYDVPFQGLAAEDNPPSEVLKIHSETVEKLGKRKHTHDSDSETEGNSKRRKRKRKISRDSVSGTENKGRESPQMKENLKTMLALQAETLQTTSDVGSMAQLVTENVSPVPRFDMATDFTRLPEILKLHTDMVQKLGELFPVKGTKWHTILKKVQLLNLLSVADVEEIETMYDLFLSLVQKKDNGITYGEYTSIRTILGTCDPFAEEIIDHYTGLIHAFYKDNLETVLALQAETSQRDNQSSISAKTTSDDESMAQLVTEKVSPDNELISAAACGHTETVTLLLEKGADPDDVAKKITFTSGKDQLTSSKCEEADVKPLYKEKRVKRNKSPGGYDTRPSLFRHEKLKMGCNIGVVNQQVQNLGGTIGPFVRYNGKTSFLTCAHVLFDVARQGTVDFTYDGSNRIDVVQPALNTSIASGAACGFIQRAIFNPRMNPSIDMAVVTISDESRLPTKGRFANDDIFRYKTAGFKHLPEYNDGSRVLDFQESGTSNMVVQFGSETHLSKGFLKEDGIQVRPLPTVLGLPQSKDIFRMSGQYEVEGLRSRPDFFMLGDSGAAVFMLNGTSLHCIGMAIGSTSTGNAVVTPIAALLDAVRANADIDLSVFP